MFACQDLVFAICSWLDVPSIKSLQYAYRRCVRFEDREILIYIREFCSKHIRTMTLEVTGWDIPMNHDEFCLPRWVATMNEWKELPRLDAYQSVFIRTFTNTYVLPNHTETTIYIPRMPNVTELQIHHVESRMRFPANMFDQFPNLRKLTILYACDPFPWPVQFPCLTHLRLLGRGCPKPPEYTYQTITHLDVTGIAYLPPWKPFIHRHTRCVIRHNEH